MSSALLPEGQPSAKRINVQTEEGLHLTLLRALVWAAVAAVIAYPLCSWTGVVAASLSAGLAVGLSRTKLLTGLRWGWVVAAGLVMVACSFWSEHLIGSSVLLSRALGPGRVLTLIEVVTFGGMLFGLVLALRTLSRRWPLLVFVEAAMVVAGVAFSFRAHRQFPFSQPQALSDWAFLQGRDPRHIIMTIGLATLVALGLLMLPRQGIRRTGIAAVILLLFSWLIFPWLIGPAVNALAALEVDRSEQSEDSPKESKPLFNPPPAARPLPPPPPSEAVNVPLMSISDAEVIEGNAGTAVLAYQVSLSAPTHRPVMVNLRTAGGSATENTDYEPQNGQLTIPPGQTAATLSINVNGDTSAETDETVFVALSTSTNALIERGRGRGVILNDDEPPVVPLLSVADVKINEGDSGETAAEMVVRLSTGAAEEVSVTFSPVEGSASDEDCSVPERTLTFPPGETEVTVPIRIKGDVEVEQDETFVVELSDASNNALIERSQAIGTIVNDDFPPPPPTLSISDASIEEGHLGLQTMTFELSLSEPSEKPIEVKIATVADTATPDEDFVPQAGSITILEGHTRALLSFEIRGDKAFEKDEQFLVRLEKPQDVELERPHGVGTIVNDDTPPQIAILDAEIKEGDDGSSRLELEVELSEPPHIPVAVEFTAVPQTAQLRIDFAQMAGRLHFPAGRTKRTAKIRVKGDLNVEPDETLLVRLHDPINAVLRRAEAVGTILNDDEYPKVSIADASAEEGDSGLTPLEFSVTLSKPWHRVVRVEYETLRYDESLENLEAESTSTTDPSPQADQVPPEPAEDNPSASPSTEPDSASATEDQAADRLTRLLTATPNRDHRPRSGFLQFFPKETSKSVSVQIIGDEAAELDEQFVVRLSEPVSATLDRKQASGTILNDDPLPKVSISDVRGKEGDGGTSVVVFVVTLSKPAAAPVEIEYETEEGTAKEGVDFIPTRGSVTIPTGATQAQIPVEIPGDAELEPPESFKMKFDPPDNAEMAQDEATATIEDEDDQDEDEDDEDDDEEDPEITIGDVELDEGSAGTTAFVFPVTLSESSSKEVEVTYNTVAGTATEGEDYELAEGTLKIPPGTTEGNITVNVLPDEDVEPDETFEVRLSEPQHATLGDETGAGSILNDDKPSLSIDDVELDEGNEESTEARFTVTLSEAVEHEVAVEYAVVGDSAAAEQDFEPTEDRLTFPAGQTTATVVVAVVADTAAEPEEQFLVVLSEPEGAKLEKDTGLGTIVNDDDPVITIEDFEAEEGTLESTPFEFRVILSSSISTDVKVDYATSAGTAAETDDFQVTEGMLTIPAGQTEASVSVDIVADEVIERDETFEVLLSEPKNAILEDETATGTILNDDKPKLSIDDVETEEANETLEATFTATLSEAIEEDVSFRYKTAPDTAEPDSDYVPRDEELTIPAGETSATIVVSIVGDEIAELQEEYEVVLSDPVRAELDKETGIGTITNDDDPSISIDDFEAEEGNTETTPFEFTVTLSSATSKDVEVDYTAVAGTAELGNDFVLAQGTLNIPTETTRATFTVEVVADEVIEKDEAFEVLLSNPRNATIDDDTGVGTILNDDKPTLSIDDRSIPEEEESGPQSVVRVHLSEAIEEDVSFTYSTHGDSAESGVDFQPIEGQTATISAGETLFAIKLQIVNDEIVELKETFEIRLSDPLKANIEQGTSVVTINDDDLPEATIEDAQIEEGNAGTTPIAFKVTLSAPTSRTVELGYFVDSRTALVRDDLTMVKGTLTFPEGETQSVVTVEVIGETQVEEDETFEAFLNKPVNAKIVRRRATGTIINDDFFPDVSVADTEVREGQAGTTAARFVITLSEASRNEITVDYETVAGSAVADEDFRPSTGTLKVPPGQTEAAVVAEIVGDNVVEEDETFELRLSNIVDAALVRDRATGTILNDDVEPPPPNTSIQDATADEGQEGTTNIEFVTELSEPAAEDVTVHYATGGGTAHPDEDYDRAEGDVTIPAGSSQATITVAIRGDTEPEQDETFEVHLSAPSNANLSRYKAIGTITNDDGPPPDDSAGEDEFNWEANDAPPSEPIQLITMDDDYNPVENAFYVRTFAYSRLEGARLRRDQAHDNDVIWALPRQPLQLPSLPPAPVLRDFSYQAYLIGKEATLPGILQTVSASPLTNPMPSEFSGAYDVTSQVLAAGYEDGKRVNAYTHIARLPMGDPNWDEASRAHYLSIPDDRRYKDLARDISRGLSPQQRNSPFARMVAVKDWMSQNLTFDYNPAHQGADDPTASFLFGDRRGYCIHLAHAMTFLLRAQDIPARLAIGYRVSSERRGQRRGFLVYSSDAHAWAEMYVEGIGWIAVEASTQGRIPPPDAEPDPREVDYYLSLLSDVPPEVFATSSGGWRRTATVGGAAGFSLGLILLYAIKFVRLLLPLVMETAAWYRVGYRSVLDRLAQVGIRRNYAETWDEFADRVGEFSPDFVPLTELHLQKSYSNADVDRSQWKELHRRIVRQIRAHVPWTKRWLGWLNPLSWLGVG